MNDDSSWIYQMKVSSSFCNELSVSSFVTRLFEIRKIGKIDSFCNKVLC